MTRRSLFGLLLCSSLCLSLLGCSGGAETKMPDPKPMPAGASFSGVWYSQQFEHMYLRQIGDSVRGIYTYKYGGTLEGKINGNMLVFDWIDPGDTTSATRTRKGKGYFTLSIDSEGNSVVKGRWGYDDDRANGGLWEAIYQRQIEGEDPRTLEEWRETEVR